MQLFLKIYRWVRVELEVYAYHMESLERVLFHLSLGRWQVRWTRADRPGFGWRIRLPGVNLHSLTLYSIHEESPHTRTYRKLAGRLFWWTLRPETEPVPAVVPDPQRDAELFEEYHRTNLGRLKAQDYEDRNRQLQEERQG